MELNCKPGQTVWIDIPRTLVNLALGLAQLQGRVVRTVSMQPASGIPAWVVDPPQVVQVVGPLPFPPDKLKPGDNLNVVSVPDAYLRPFTDFAPEELQEVPVAARQG